MFVVTISKQMEMKRFKNIFPLILLLIGLSSCYDDKGNYDYIDLNMIKIKESYYNSSLSIGDTLRISPVFEYKYLDTLNMRLTYSWTFCERLIGTDRNLVWVVDTSAEEYIKLRVHDEDHDVIYLKGYHMKIQTPYVQPGWLVLTEKDGESSVTFMREIEKEDPENPDKDIYDYKIYENPYKQVNHSSLGSRPVKMVQHFARRTEADGSILVLQDGAESVDVNGTTFGKEIDLHQAFLDQTYPPGFRAVDAHFMAWTDLIQNDDGKIYSRQKLVYTLFHSGYFIPKPLEFEQEEIRGDIIMSVFRNSKFCLVYDKGVRGDKKRFLVVYDMEGANGLEFAKGKVGGLPVPVGGWPENFAPLTGLGNKELVYAGYNMSDSWTGLGYFMLLKDMETGEYTGQQFFLERDYNTTAMMYTKDVNGRDRVSVHPMPAGFRYENCVIYSVPREQNPYVMIADGLTLYLFNRENPQDGLARYYQFEAPVVGMNAEMYGGEHLGVALSNGQVVILDIEDGKNKVSRPDDEKLIWRTDLKKDNLGNIKMIRYRSSTNSDWGLG